MLDFVLRKSLLKMITLLLFLSLSFCQTGLSTRAPLVVAERPSNHSGEGNGLTHDDTKEQHIPEPPPFLLEIFHKVDDKSVDEEIKAFSLHEERDSKTGEFQLLAWRVARSVPIHKAEIYISTHKFARIPNVQTPIVSIYEVSSGTKVSSRPLSSRHLDWLCLPVTTMIKRWIAHRDQPLRFRVLVEVNDEDESLAAVHDQWNHSTPWLVVYTDKVTTHTLPHLALGNRVDAGIKGFSSERPKRQIVPETIEAQEAVGCRKMDMIVNTTTLGWSSWLTRPKIFNAYQCKGNCSKSMQLGYINHAFLKALVHQKLGDANGHEPCCVPTKMRSIPFIYRLENRGFVLRRFDNMVVEECGCN